MIVLFAYRTPIDKHGEVTKVDGVWRIVVGVSLVPAFGTLYQRLVLPESRRYKQAQEKRELDDIADLKLRQRREDAEREGVPEVAAAKKDEPDANQGQEIKVVEAPSGSGDSSEQASVREQPVIEKHDAHKKAHFRGASLVIVLRCPGLRYGARATRAPLRAREMDTAHRARDMLPFPVVSAIPDREPPEIVTDCAVVRKRGALLLPQPRLGLARLVARPDDSASHVPDTN